MYLMFGWRIFDWDGTIVVLVGVLGVLVGVLCVLFGVLGVLVDIFLIGMAYLMSLVFGMVYLLHEM